MHGHAGGGAVIDVEARVERFELEGTRLTGAELSDGGPAPRAGDGVKVDRVRVAAALAILEVDLNHVSHAHPDQRSGHRAVERPERVANTICERARHLCRLEVHDHARIALAIDGWGNERWRHEDRLYLGPRRAGRRHGIVRLGP